MLKLQEFASTQPGTTECNTCIGNYPCEQSSSIHNSRLKKNNLTNLHRTAIFIDYVLTFRNIINIKITVERIHKRLPDCHPIHSVNGSHFMWLNKF